MRAAQHQRIDAVCKQWFEVFAYGQAGNFMFQPTFRLGTGMLFVTEFVEAVFLCPTGIFVLTRCGLSADLSFVINFYGLTLFAAGGLNNGGVNDGGGCFLYF